MKPFLTLVCRCCQRPKMLTKALKSVLAQIDWDLEVIFIVDTQRRGVRWANQQFGKNIERVQGKYVYTLDDDTFLPNPKLVTKLKRVPGSPAVIMVKGRRPQLKPYILPKASVWGKRGRLRVASTNGACFIVRADYWAKHAHRYGMKGSGDWNFLSALKSDGSADFHWLNFIAKETQQLGRGVKFEDCGRDWFARIRRQFGLVRVGKGDYRLSLYRMESKDIPILGVAETSTKRKPRPTAPSVPEPGTVVIPITPWVPPGQRWGETIVASVRRQADAPPHSLLSRRKR